MDRKIRYFVNGWSFRLSFATRPGYDGDHEDISDGDSYELGEYENSEEALAAAEAFISTHGNEVNDEEDEVIGYNVGFDLGFLSAVGVRPREDARITDTMKEFTWFMGRRYKLVDAADHIGYEWTGRAHGSLADALATLAVQRWLEQWLVAE